MTRYVVFEVSAADGDLQQGPTIEAASGEAAIRKSGLGAGQFVAIPERSITRRQVKTETVQRLFIEPVKDGATARKRPAPGPTESTP